MNTLFGDLEKKGRNGTKYTGSVPVMAAVIQDTSNLHNGGDDDLRLMRHFVRDFIEQQEN
jgi:hypothetical protein